MKNFDDLKNRSVSVAVFAGITLTFVLLGAEIFSLYLAALVVYCAFEWAKFSRLDVKYILIFVTLHLTISTLALTDSSGRVYVSLLCSVPFIVLLSFFYKKFCPLAGVLYLSFVLVSIVLYFKTVDTDRWWIEFTVLWAGVMAADIGAYTVGRFWGKRKLVPVISPSKTWEGLLGALLSTFLLYVGIAVYFTKDISGGITRIFLMGGLGIVVAVVSQVGDLYISKIKRTYDVKDCGSIMPGHGGLLDRLDGLFAVIAVFSIFSHLSLLFLAVAQ